MNRLTRTQTEIPRQVTIGPTSALCAVAAGTQVAGQKGTHPILHSHPIRTGTEVSLTVGSTQAALSIGTALSRLCSHRVPAYPIHGNRRRDACADTLAVAEGVLYSYLVTHLGALTGVLSVNIPVHASPCAQEAPASTVFGLIHCPSLAISGDGHVQTPCTQMA